MTDFAGLQVLVTRPGESGADLCAQISERGGSALHFPVIAFAPPPDLTAFQQAIQQLGEQEWMIFNSPEAVRAAVPAMRAAWPNFPEQVKFAAVGAGTAKALHAAGYAGVVYPEQEWSSEGLLAMPAFREVSGKKIAMVRGVGGRELIDKTLRERGAKVLPVIAYQRVLPQTDSAACLAMLREGRLDVIVAGSFESVSNLLLLLGSESWKLLKEVPLIVMSERVKKLAAESGFRTIWVAQTASQQAVLDLIAEKKDILCQRKTK